MRAKTFGDFMRQFMRRNPDWSYRDPDFDVQQWRQERDARKAKWERIAAGIRRRKQASQERATERI